MQYFFVIIAVWFLIGGVVSLFKKLSFFRKAVVTCGQIVDLTKKSDQGGLTSYIPEVEYLDNMKNELVKKSLERDSMSALFFKRRVKVWIVIDQLGKARALVSAIMELLFPVALIILGITLLIQGILTQIL